MVACGERGQRLVDRLAFVKLDAAFTCYRSVGWTCHFPPLGKQREQSDTENIVRSVRKPIRAYDIPICVSSTITYFKKFFE